MKLLSCTTRPRGGGPRSAVSGARQPAPRNSILRAAPATSAPTTTSVLDWPSVEAAAATAAGPLPSYTTRPGLVPASSPNPALAIPATGEVAEPSSTAQILFARDTHGWCPFAQRVWMALSYLGVPFETVFVDLRAKPSWYALVPTSKVPALFLATPSQLAAAGPAGVPVSERELVFESLDILARLDADFPGKLSPPGTDEAAAKAALALADKFGKKRGEGERVLREQPCTALPLCRGRERERRRVRCGPTHAARRGREEGGRLGRGREGRACARLGLAHDKLTLFPFSTQARPATPSSGPPPSRAAAPPPPRPPLPARPRRRRCRRRGRPSRPSWRSGRAS